VDHTPLSRSCSRPLLGHVSSECHSGLSRRYGGGFRRSAERSSKTLIDGTCRLAIRWNTMPARWALTKGERGFRALDFSHRPCRPPGCAPTMRSRNSGCAVREAEIFETDIWDATSSGFLLAYEIALHLLAQPGRAVVRAADRQETAPRSTPVNPGPGERHSRLDHQLERQPETLQLDQDRRRDPRTPRLIYSTDSLAQDTSDR
jgi:hypothetical protein